MKYMNEGRLTRNGTNPLKKRRNKDQSGRSRALTKTPILMAHDDDGSKTHQFRTMTRLVCFPARRRSA